MDGSELGSVDGTALVNGVTDHIDNSSQGFRTDGDENGCTSVVDGLTSDETVSGVQGDGSHVVTTEMLSDLEHETVLSAVDLEGVENGGESTIELHVDDGTNDLGNSSY